MDAAENASIGIIVLAAGASSRMQKPKQLLTFQGQTLLRRAVATAVASVFKPVVVVLGANGEQTKREIENLPVNICFNENYQEGLSSSIKTGLTELLKIDPAISGILITLADQPFITTEILNSFLAQFRKNEKNEKSIVAAEYREITGVPALFAKGIFAELFQLTGDRGARAIFEKYSESLEKISLPEAAFDIDTPQDFERLVKSALPESC